MAMPDIVAVLTIRYSQLLNEIMPMIYKRFTDKAAEEWRQIYKVSRVSSVLLSTVCLTLLGPATP